jgi:predicted DNA-binding transcriptional regulator YafY
LYFNKQTKPKNENAYIAANLLFTAASTRKRVRFMYYEYGSDKQKTYKHKCQVYEFSPWSFIWNNDSYYIIGHSESHGKAVKFRVDRIAAPKLTELDAVPMPDGFDLAAFVQSVFQMVDGPMLDVTLKCKNSLMKTIIDRFGEDVPVGILDAEHFRANVSVSASAAFYGWVFGLDGAAEITAPREAVEEYTAMLSRQKPLYRKNPDK